METVPTHRPPPPPAETRAPRVSGERAGVSQFSYLPGLDGLRAVAVVAVMVYHAHNAWLPGGFLGVEVFFVISGYLITLLLISEHERTNRIRLGHFWLRRARRLLPALFLMMTLLVVYAAFFERDILGQLRGDFLAGTFYVSNWYQIWTGAGYTAMADLAPLRHLWSLGVEEQFYLLWPLIMAALLRRKGSRIADSSRWLVVAAFGVTVATALLFQPGRIDPSENPDAFWTAGERSISIADALYLNTFSRSSGLLLGAALAMLWRPRALSRGPVREKGPLVDLLALVGMIGLGLMAWYVHVVEVNRPDPLLFRGGFLLAGLASLFVIAAATHPRAITGRLLGNPLFVWIGTRSYGLYLFHWPIYRIIQQRAGNLLDMTISQFVLALAITVVLTELSYRFVEMPIRRGVVGRWWSRLRAQRDPTPRRTIAVTGAVCVAVATFAGVNLATAELKQNEVAANLEQAEEFIATVPTSASSVDDGTGTPSDPTRPTRTQGGGNPPPPVTEVPTTQPPGTDMPTTTPPSDPPPPPMKGRVAVGDSVMLGAAQDLTEDHGFAVYAKESRSFDAGIDVVRSLLDQGLIGDVVAIQLGVNQDTVEREDYDTLMQILRDVPTVVFITNRYDAAHVYEQNESIRQLPSRYPNVRVLDWSAVGNECRGACYFDDNLHLDGDGRQFFADKIAETAGL